MQYLDPIQYTAWRVLFGRTEKLTRYLIIRHLHVLAQYEFASTADRSCLHTELKTKVVVTDSTA